MSHADFSNLIPHQSPMCLVDTLLDYDAEHLWAAVTPTQHSLFATSNGVPACIGLEYLAQAAAGFFTLQANTDTPPKQGMLIACRRFTTQIAFYPLAQRLLLHVTLSSTLPPDTSGPGLVKFRGEVFTSRHNVAAEQAVTVADLSVYL